MQTYDFVLLLKTRRNPDIDDTLNALFLAGCDDGTFGIIGGVAQIRFSREADSLGAAIDSAVADVAKAGVGMRAFWVEAAVPKGKRTRTREGGR